MWWSKTRGILSGTIAELSRLAGCTETEWIIFHEENSRLKFADVTLANKIVTVTNRRMVREQQSRESTRLRVKRFRNASCNAKVTVPSPNTPTPGTKVPKKHSVAVAPELPLRGKRMGPYQAMVASYFWTFEKEHKTKPVITPADGKNASLFCEGKDPELTAWLAWEYLTNPTDYASSHYRFSLRDVVMDSANLLGRPRKRPLPREIVQLIGGNNGDDRKEELPGKPVRNHSGLAPVVDGEGAGIERKP
jgi:hypothetical protein